MMTDAQKKLKKYTDAVARRLNMPRDVKVRVMNDFISSIQGRREAGQTDDEIFSELGSPKKAAAELNEQMKEFTYVKSPWRWVCLAIIICCCLALLFNHGIGFVTFLFNLIINESAGAVGGADGPTHIFVTVSPDFYQYHLTVTLILLVMGILGYWALRHCKRK